MPSARLPKFCDYPVVQAPMAGGAASVGLVDAVRRGGALGFLAGGYKRVEALREEVRDVRARGAECFGVNLFVPQPAGDSVRVKEYAARLAREARTYEVELGDPAGGGDDGYEAKLDLLLGDPVGLVSFTFGCPEPRVLGAFRKAGTYTVVTVTSVEEARVAQEAGADAVCVQGAEAGGHQGSYRDDPQLDGARGALLSLLPQVRRAVDVPLIAAGGLMRGGQIAAVLAAGADAAQLGTAFLACPESGAHPLHKRALTDPAFGRTELTRAFTGRPARALVNRFVREHGPYAPSCYPQVHHLTAPLRKAAAARHDAQGMALWAGRGHGLARAEPAERLVGLLVEEMAEATA